MLPQSTKPACPFLSPFFLPLFLALRLHARSPFCHQIRRRRRPNHHRRARKSDRTRATKLSAASAPSPGVGAAPHPAPERGAGRSGCLEGYRDRSCGRADLVFRASRARSGNLSLTPQTFAASGHWRPGTAGAVPDVTPAAQRRCRSLVHGVAAAASLHLRACPRGKRCGNPRLSLLFFFSCLLPKRGWPAR
ncbi:hypothetical protein BDY21DRAFT_338837 [Lineolata rhizophorae]|uniref:Secreted protein n=1 Tax=Lineolata rhizophorae TaxID=578093 RepID=A0A6A6P6Z3_9PEZI|nr:hypothetical protein BDY21DRAFT_338837 [Lineolata rhizophorae]